MRASYSGYYISLPSWGCRFDSGRPLKRIKKIWNSRSFLVFSTRNNFVFFFTPCFPKNTFPFRFRCFRRTSLTHFIERGAVLYQSVNHARPLPIRSSRMWPSGNRMKEKESVFEKLSKQTLFHQQTFVSSRNFQARIFQSNFWEPARARFFLKEKECGHKGRALRRAGASDRYFGRLLACEVSPSYKGKLFIVKALIRMKNFNSIA